jgi:hypothetical protein
MKTDPEIRESEKQFGTQEIMNGAEITDLIPSSFPDFLIS